MVMGPNGARNQERLCWRGPAAIYWNVNRSQMPRTIIGVMSAVIFL
jgi:hypothetical protein